MLAQCNKFASPLQVLWKREISPFINVNAFMIYLLVFNTNALLNPVYFEQINFHFNSANGNGNPFSRKRTLTFCAFSVPKY